MRSTVRICRSLTRPAALVGMVLLALAAFGATARAVVLDGSDAAQVQSQQATLVVCKQVEGVERLESEAKFAIKVGSNNFWPVITTPGPNGAVCEKFTFDTPTKVLIYEEPQAPWTALFTYQPRGGGASLPVPLPAGGAVLFLYPGTCALEELKEPSPGAGNAPDCTVTIINRTGSAAQLDAFSLTKTPVIPVVDDPADIAFDIVLSSSYRLRTPDSLHINFYDPGVSVIDGPHAVKASCGTPPMPWFEYGLASFALRNDECKSFSADVNGLEIRFRVRPKQLPQRTCEDQVISNTAMVHLLAETMPYSTFPKVDVKLQDSASVILKGDPARCPVTIRVHKTLNVVGFTSDGPGWQFTLEGCGVGPLTGTTGADGVVEFPDLPPAVGCSYTITETLQPGWTPQFVTQTVQPQQGGETVTVDFLNIRDFNPPCVDPADPRCAPPPPPPTPPPPARPAGNPCPARDARSARAD
ncbi:MSCRAMM family protein [Tepidiforma bonchosmolovskayae]|uniref:MSCRAMM family protein n=1 Tax=Tepidiforma bonchosmolovskayae TaxID=2601677 RepID=UPI001787E318|nr:prealbumin-like fold domain-containing protein [Tepidiforma bonchosmolovskayae]